MASLHVIDSPKETIEDKRKRCLLGELPEDFLRLPMLHQGQNPNISQAMAYSQQIPTPQYITTQQLEITIIQARLAKNYGLTRMDPYCKVRIGHKTYETVTAFNGSKNPYWNKKFFCPIPKGVEAIHVSIFDEKTMGSDEEIAFALITFPPEIFNGNVVDSWYPLSGRQGDNQEGQINIVLSIKEIQMLQQPSYAMPIRQMIIPGYASQHPQQLAVRPAPVITESDVDQIYEMFPTVEKKVIKAMLEEHSGNKELAISALLVISEKS